VKSVFSAQQTILQLHLYLCISDINEQNKSCHHVNTKLRVRGEGCVVATEATKTKHIKYEPGTTYYIQ